MKIAKIIPLFKTGDDSEFTNYRPVSLLPQFSKILENIFKNSLDNFIESCDILSDSQYGFRPKRSTALPLIDLVGILTKELDNKKITVGVFIDLKKGFDTIDHTLLIFICCFTWRSTARVILRRVVYGWRKPVHTAL